MTELVEVIASENPVLDVVFVHGLDGDAYKSWSTKRKGSFWPEWLGRDIEGLAVWSLGYDAASSRWLGHAMPIQDRAINLLAHLENHGIGQRPLCFITHSMGGLVVKEMLLHAADGRADYTEFATATRGVVFLATPHNGSDIVTMAIVKALAVAYRKTPAVDALERNSAHLRQLNTRYRNWTVAPTTNIKHKMFYEAQSTRGVQVVDAGSADPAIPGQTPIPVDANHIDICKPAERGDVVYGQVKSFISGIAGALRAGADGYGTRPSGVKVTGLDQVVDRPELGARLLAELTAGDQGLVGLVGAGGFGKTTLASWACAQTQQHFRDGVYWFRLNSDTNESVLIDLLGAATAVLTGRDRVRPASVEGATEAFAAALGKRRMLLVVDGLVKRADLEPFLVGGPHCMRLVTTRRRGLVRGCELDVEAMTVAEAASLLCRDVDSSVEPPAALLDRVGRWPLALSLLNGVLTGHVRRRMPVALAFQELDAVLTRSGVGLLDDLTDNDSGPKIGATLQLSLHELVATSPFGEASLERYLTLIAFPERLPVPYGLLSALWDLDTVMMTSECDRFFRHSLVVELAEDGVRLHDVIGDHLRRTHPEQVRDVSRRLLDAVRPPDGWHHADDVVRQQLAHHLLSAGLAGELAALCLDLRYLARRIDSDGVHAAEADVSAYLTTEADSSAHASLLTILRAHSHLLHTTDSALSLYCHLFGHVTVTHLEEALPAWSLRPDRPLPTTSSTGLLRSLVGHHGLVSSVQWMTNETVATVGGDDGTLRVWDCGTGRTQSAVEVSEHLVLRSRLSPDGRLLAQLVHDHPISGRGRPATAPKWLFRTVVTDTRDGSVISIDHLSGIDMYFEGMAYLHWSADSELLAVAGGGCLRIWRPRAEPSTSPTQTHPIGARALSWHPDAGLVGISRDAVYVWADPTSPAHPRELWFETPADEMVMRTVAWSPDGHLIAIGMDFAVVVLDAVTGQRVLSEFTTFGICGSVTSLAWRPDGALLAIAGNGDSGGTVAWWWPAQKHWTMLVDSGNAVTDLAWSADGCVLAVASVDSTVRLFSGDATSPPPAHSEDFRRSEPPPEIKISSLSSGARVAASTSLEARDDHTLIAMSVNGLVAVEANVSEKFAWVMSSAQACSDFGVLPHVARKVFGRPDERLELRTVPGRALVRELSWPKPRALAISPDRAVMITTTEEGHITAYDLCTFDQLCTVAIDEPVIVCWFTETGDRLIVLGSRNTYSFKTPG
ncbi:NB-ARC domain-containing protein [Amycolatopsis sp. NPDC051071]|uniref:WD40 domain-containing protein n=1 Tax=Amycolatopsis sp. NPDC051071 TaxID=3154637 RepID=UPI00343ECC2C